MIEFLGCDETRISQEVEQTDIEASTRTEQASQVTDGDLNCFLMYFDVLFHDLKATEALALKAEKKRAITL